MNESTTQNTVFHEFEKKILPLDTRHSCVFLFLSGRAAPLGYFAAFVKGREKIERNPPPPVSCRSRRVFFRVLTERPGAKRFDD